MCVCIFSHFEETVTAIMMLFRNTKAKLSSPDINTDFDIAGVLLGATIEQYFFIICLDYVLQTSIDPIKENGFTLKKKPRSRHYATETIKDADYADDTALLANTLALTESLVHCLEQAK